MKDSDFILHLKFIRLDPDVCKHKPSYSSAIIFLARSSFILAVKCVGGCETDG